MEGGTANEDIIKRRLHEITKRIELLTKEASSYCKGSEDYVIKDAQICASKLDSMVKLFSSVLNEYFKYANSPSADEVSQMSNIQLDGEQTLAELRCILNRNNSTEVRVADSLRTFSAKLPAISLPEFSGDVLTFNEFWDAFKSNIHERSIPDVDKLLYLKSTLKGEPRRIIDGFETTNTNYGIAVQVLTERYGKTSQIIDAHYSAISNIKEAKTVTECRTVFNDIERHLRVLQSLGEDTKHNQLRHLIKEKFPGEIIYEMRMRMKEDTVEEMRRNLGIIITAREESNTTCYRQDTIEKPRSTVETLHATDRQKQSNSSYKGNHRKQDFKRKPDQKQNFRRKPYDDQRPSTSSQFGRKRNRSDQPSEHKPDGSKVRRISCIFCDKAHYSDQCQKFKSVSERKLKLKKRCYICFSETHLAKFCKTRRECVYCKKTGHHRALCPQKFEEKKVATMTSIEDSGITVLQTAVVTLKNDKGEVNSMKCRVLLDSGSQRSYITEHVSRELNLPVLEENELSVFGFANDKPQQYTSYRVKLDIVTRTDEVITLYANEVPMISTGIEPHRISSGICDGKALADDGSLGKRIDILVGNEYYFNLISTEKIKVKDNLFLVNSKFGWILSGRLPTDSCKNTLSIITYCEHSNPRAIYFTEPDLPLKNLDLSFLWNMESIGITDDPKTTREEEAIKHLNETIQYVDSRYLVKWPWTHYPPDLPTNFGLAYGRLKALFQRMDPTSIKEYQEILNDQLKDGIIEITNAPEEMYTQRVPPIHYIPHHMIKQDGKKGRIVYDASGKLKDQKSLNECMYKGPAMLSDLVALLIQFRTQKIAISADIEKAFLQIGLQPDDREVTRFLWLKDIKKPVTIDNIIHMRFCRVPFGIIASPFILTAVMKYHVAQRAPELSHKLIDKCYVDNFVSGAESTEEAKQLYINIRKIFQEISMNMRDWTSNDKYFLESIPVIQRAKEATETKILGLKWNTEEDTLRLNIKCDLFKKENVTREQSKRKILSIIASIYDPYGLTSPLTLPAKLLLQELWEMKMKWDTILPENIQRKWEDIVHRLEAVKSIKIPRYVGITDIKKTDFQIHAFSDASKHAYACVLYLVAANEDKRRVSFVMAKSKVVPKEEKENLRMPRLELLGLYLANKVLIYVKKNINIPIKKTCIWTDSQIVLNWINSNKLLPPFYSRRVNTIKEHKDLEVFYVESDNNPADLATRPELWNKKKQLWLKGPEFLKKKLPHSSARQGPSEVNTEINLMEIDYEIPDTEFSMDKITEITIDNEEHKGVESDTKIILDLQKEYFPQEFEGRKTSLAINLDLFKDIDGVLRSRGRMKNANWSFDKRHPILIPRDTKFTNDLVMDVHKKNYHVGANHTLSKIREVYWIPKGKSYVQRILRKCQKCIKHDGGPFKLPPAPALPAERVIYSSPFTYVGVDYMGPVFINNGHGSCKRWICLYTCLVVRAVHLEIVEDLTAEESLLAFRRMVAARGVPELVTSDNAQYFKLLGETLSGRYCIDNKVKWRFITPLSPWKGGFYERLVGIVKNCLKKTLDKHMLRDTQLVTIIKEVEAVVNSRPLTSVDSELDHVLKPSDFLTVGKVITMNDPNMILELQPDSSRTKTDLVQSWKRARIILNEFKNMFVNRYLLSLRERYHHLPREPRVTSKLSPALGQLVQIKGDSKNRYKWKVGKIIDLIPSTDGVCRTAKVRVGENEYTRSISQLYPLEVEDTDNSFLETPDENLINGIPPVQPLVPETVDNTVPVEDTSCSTMPEMSPSSISQKHEENHMDSADTPVNEETNDVPDHDYISETLPKSTELDINEDETTIASRPRRKAALKAREKIENWTRELTTFLLHSTPLPSVGSVATSASQ